MNIVEALKAANGQEWIYRKTAEWRQILVTTEDKVDLSLEELLADDWVVAEKEVMVSRSKFDLAWIKAASDCQDDSSNELKDLLAKELGL